MNGVNLSCLDVDQLLAIYLGSQNQPQHQTFKSKSELGKARELHSELGNDFDSSSATVIFCTLHLPIASLLNGYGLNDLSQCFGSNPCDQVFKKLTQTMKRKMSALSRMNAWDSCFVGKHLQQFFGLFGFFQIPSHLLHDAYLTYLRNLMLLPDVWMKITMTGKGVPITS